MILLHFDEIAERSQQQRPCLPLTLTMRTSWDKAVFFGKTKTDYCPFKKDGGGLKEKETDRGRRRRRNPQKGWYSGSWIFLFQFNIVSSILSFTKFQTQIFRLKLRTFIWPFASFQNHHDWRPVRAQVSFVFRRASRPLEKLNRTDRCCCCALLTITKTFSRE